MADVRRVTKENAIAIVRGLKALYANQNAIGKIKVGETTFTADEAVDELKLVGGTNVDVTISGDTVTFAATDTTYDDVVADCATSGLMTGADKAKLDGIAAGAEVNQNAFAGVKVGADTVNASAKTDVVELVAGTNVTIVVGQDGKLTFSAIDTTYDDVVADATGAADSGLMTSGDKAKLDGVEDGAQANVIEGVKVGTDTVTPASKVVSLGTAAGASTAASVANDATLPTGAAVTAFVEGKGYQTAADVATAIAGAQHISMSVVATLPASGEANVIYLVPDDQGGSNKDMYIWQSDAFVLVGNTEVDLTDYVKFDDLGALTEAEVAEILAEA